MLAPLLHDRCGDTQQTVQRGDLPALAVLWGPVGKQSGDRSAAAGHSPSALSARSAPHWHHAAAASAAASSTASSPAVLVDLFLFIETTKVCNIGSIQSLLQCTLNDDAVNNWKCLNFIEPNAVHSLFIFLCLLLAYTIWHSDWGSLFAPPPVHLYSRIWSLPNSSSWIPSVLHEYCGLFFFFSFFFDFFCSRKEKMN